MSTTASDELLLVFCTFPNSDDAAQVAQQLVGDGLVACVNILRDVRSIYFWQGEIVNATEVLCLMKTQSDNYAELVQRLSEMHPYTVPEIVGVRPSAVNEPYLKWVLSETSGR
ncbi:MAG: divalent-cation tolerance protein CutA [Myxococcales bacterium]|nr:divalent-cation tolerance protein CutA [Myxococcales bacterium]